MSIYPSYFKMRILTLHFVLLNEGCLLSNFTAEKDAASCYHAATLLLGIPVL